LLNDTGNYSAAEENYQAALSLRREHLGEQHPLVAQTLNNLAFLYVDMGNTERAIELSREAVAIFRAAYPGDHPEIAYSTQNLAGWLVETDNYEAAEPLFREALQMNQRLFDPGNADIAITQTGMAILYLRSARATAALEMAEAAYAPLVESYGQDHWRTAWALATQGAAMSQLGNYSESEPLLLQSYEELGNNPGARPVHVETARRYLVELYTAWDRPDEAARYTIDSGASSR
jgi:tetratricopeptide (TPR) repeat protein